MIGSHQMWRNVKPRICQVVSKQKGDYSYSTGPNEGWLCSLSHSLFLCVCACIRAHVCAQVHVCVCVAQYKKRAVITALSPLAPYNAFFCRVWSFRHWTGCFLFRCVSCFYFKFLLQIQICQSCERNSEFTQYESHTIADIYSYEGSMTSSFTKHSPPKAERVEDGVSVIYSEWYLDEPALGLSAIRDCCWLKMFWLARTVPSNVLLLAAVQESHVLSWDWVRGFVVSGKYHSTLILIRKEIFAVVSSESV